MQVELAVRLATQITQLGRAVVLITRNSDVRALLEAQDPQLLVDAEAAIAAVSEFQGSDLWVEDMVADHSARSGR